VLAMHRSRRHLRAWSGAIQPPPPGRPQRRRLVHLVRW